MDETLNSIEYTCIPNYKFPEIFDLQDIQKLQDLLEELMRNTLGV